MGYPNVRHLAEGISGWEASGAPVEKGGTDLIPLGAHPGQTSPSAEPGAAPAAPAGTVGRMSRARHSAPHPSNDLVARVLERIAGTTFTRLLGVWLAIVVGCGLLYWAIDLMWGTDLREAGGGVPATLEGLLTAIYFSFVTATSIGFGDVVPLGVARVIAIFEGASGLLIFGAIISKLVSKRQEDLIEETHRIAYEARLGRIRTNLHLVLSELQTMSSDCGPGGLTPEKMLPRLESAAMVFSGELQSIHDLLYRPQLIPEEPVLEALLANLAAGMGALEEILVEFPQLRERSGMLESRVASISGLANEICGECVPRDYAPELKEWMDKVQDLAGQLSARRA